MPSVKGGFSLMTFFLIEMRLKTIFLLLLRM